jgi:hypothetical protein
MWFSMAQREGGGIHDLQLLGQRLVVGQRLVLGGLGILHGVGGVDAVHLGGLEQELAPISLARRAAALSVVK